MTEQHKSQSVSIMLRIRRTTVEDAFVAIPVTDAIMKMQPDGNYGMDPDAFTSEVIRISNDERVEWKVESTQIEPHQIQTPLPTDRRCFDAFDDLRDSQNAN
jgi:hypothetical protein